MQPLSVVEGASGGVGESRWIPFLGYMWGSCRDQYEDPLVLTQQIIGQFGLAEWVWESALQILWLEDVCFWDVQCIELCVPFSAFRDVLVLSVTALYPKTPPEVLWASTRAHFEDLTQWSYSNGGTCRQFSDVG